MSSRCEYVYDHGSIEAAKMNEYMTAKVRIEKTFEVTNTMAVVVPKGIIRRKRRLLRGWSRWSG